MPRSTYVRELRGELPSTFPLATSRLAFIPAHLAVIALSIAVIATGLFPWFLLPLPVLAIGASFAGLTFVGHETMHGGIVRGRRLRHALTWICFVPFTLSPRLWAAWHDRVHHARANLPGDPDMYPTLAEYRASRKARFFMDTFSMGHRRWTGGLSLLLGFTVQSVQQLIRAREREFLRRPELALAVLEMAAGVAVWVALAIAIGPLAFLLAFVLPLLIANAIVMSFILTNHGLSPRVEINDPLASALSVTLPRWLEWLTLDFGFHVEHHLFPKMSARHGRVVRELLLEKWPERYQTMPHHRAIAALHRTARVYKDAITQVDPRSGTEHAVLQPGLRAS